MIFPHLYIHNALEEDGTQKSKREYLITELDYSHKIYIFRYILFNDMYYYTCLGIFLNASLLDV